MTKRLILFVLFLAVLGPIAAQDGGELQAITAQNVSTLVEIASLGEEDRNAQYTHLAFSPNGDYLIFDTTFQTAETRLEGNIYVWQLDPLTQIATFPGSVQGFIDDTQFSYCVGNEMQYVFDLALEDIVSQIPTGWCGIIDPSGKIVATGEGYYFYLHLRDANTGEILADSEIPAVWLAFSHDGSLLATSSILNEIALWKVAEILEVDKLTTDDAIAVMPHQGVEEGPGGDIAFSPDGNTLVYSSIDGMFVRDNQREAVVAELGDNVRANGIAFNPNGQLMVNGTRSDEVVRIWDTGTWQQITELPIYQATAIAFNPQGTLLATTGRTPGTVTLWGIPVPEG